MNAVIVPRADKPVVLLTTLGLFALSLILQHEFRTEQALLLLVGVGLGVTLYHAAFGFTGGWRRFIQLRDGTAIRAHIGLLALTSLLFFPVLGQALGNFGAHAALGPFGVSVLIGAFLFGIGMQLGGGCGSGTLYTVGGGHVRMLITLTFFIVGTVIGTAHLHWWLQLPALGEISVINSVGWAPALILQLAVLGVLYMVVRRLERPAAAPTQPAVAGGFIDRLVSGPWPLWWGVVGLAGLNLLTLLLAGHPWSITFAFGLWGAKVWNAVGGDVSSWPYWSSGYPALALERSVLADTTSLMDFGLILGAVLAAGLAGRFAPPARLRLGGVLTAVIGGLLLGYGARLAFGCNIGGMLAGIVSGSAHGWLWLLAGFCGTIVGVKLRGVFGIDKPARSPQ